ncbi:MAG: hypothetical protein ACLQVN_15790 [Bryobacteraceae bacterium]
MDLRIYYQKIRDAQGKLSDPYPVIVSRETPDGGKEGMLTEVPAGIAAKMVVDGAARLATAEETQTYRQAQAEAKRLADQAEAARKIQVTVVSSSEFERLRGGQKSSKG